MAWVQLGVTGLLALLVVLLASVALGLRRRVADLEHRLAAHPPSSDAPDMPGAPDDLPHASLDEPRPAPEFVITRVGEAEEVVAPASQAGRTDPVPVVDARLFADIVARESVVQAASLAHGLRRALSPETRNRIRFHMRQEVKRSRKQRRSELRAVRREWAARQRAAMTPDEPAADGTAA